MIYLVTELRVEGGGNDPDLAAIQLALQTNVREQGYSLSSILQDSGTTCSGFFESRLF